MSLNQKFTWNDFLNENPEFKQKKVKRTSSEGKKAFEAAFRGKMKDILKDRLAWFAKEQTRAAEKKTALALEIKSSKKPARRRDIQMRIGAAEKYIHKLGKLTERTKQIQKNA